MNDMTAEEIKASIEGLAAQHEALSQALEDTIEKERLAMLDEIRAIYEDAGYTAEAIADMLMPKQQAKTAKRAGTGRGGQRPMFVLNSDQSRVYRRGVLPDWLKSAMRSNGYDPAEPDDRTNFRSLHMTEVAA